MKSIYKGNLLCLSVRVEGCPCKEEEFHVNEEVMMYWMTDPDALPPFTVHHDTAKTTKKVKVSVFLKSSVAKHYM